MKTKAYSWNNLQSSLPLSNFSIHFMHPLSQDEGYSLASSQHNESPYWIYITFIKEQISSTFAGFVQNSWYQIRDWWCTNNRYQDDKSCCQAVSLFSKLRENFTQHFWGQCCQSRYLLNFVVWFIRINHGQSMIQSKLKQLWQNAQSIKLCKTHHVEMTLMF